MKKFFLFILLSGVLYVYGVAQVNLTGAYDRQNAAIRLNWNMVKSNDRTFYLLLRSADGITWSEAARDRMYRFYSEDDLFFFNDRYFVQGKNYYRIKISDTRNNTVALSPVIIVNTAASTPVYQGRSGTQGTVPVIRSEPTGSNNWVLYPNPVTDVLKLMYKGSSPLKGVVNVQVQDMSGKIVIKFRSGSMYRNLEIPVDNLQRGAYFLQLSVQNDVMLSQKFVKQ